MNNLLVVHGGAPTAVINSSLYGIIFEAKKHQEIHKIFGANYGCQGILEENFIDLTDLEDSALGNLLATSASAIGTSRIHLEHNDYDAMAKILQKHGIKYLLMTGGNGTMDTCRKLGEHCLPLGITTVGIPKTIDNDISATDHAPGFGSAARFVVQSTFDIGQDVKSMPIHVCIYETMGRNAGWLAAASALARQGEGDAPHLIYIPEVAFDTDQFLLDVQNCIKKHTHVVIVVSEGLCDKDGNSIVPPIFSNHRSVYYGDISAYLATLVIQRLGVKARGEKPGILCRSLALAQSPVDRDEAIAVGRQGVVAVLAGETNTMVSIRRISSTPYQCELEQIPISDEILEEKKLSTCYFSADTHDVTQDFLDWCKPLVGEISLKKNLLQ